MWNIKRVGMPPSNISTFLHPLADDLRLETLSIYSIAYECGIMHMGLTGQSIEMKMK
jgi:hypothetical protein